MRWVDFTKLRQLLCIVTDRPAQLTPTELNHAALATGNFVTSSGQPLKKTSLYHLRRTMVQLGLVTQRDGRYVPTLKLADGPLLEHSPKSNVLSIEQRIAFADRVLRNKDCNQIFWSAFAPGKQLDSLDSFTRLGQPVRLQLEGRESPRDTEPRVTLTTQSEEMVPLVHHGENAVQAIHFGMRDWGVKQLSFVDELYQTGGGYLLFPITIPPRVPERAIEVALFNSLAFTGEWATHRVSCLLLNIAIRLRVNIAAVRQVLERWIYQHPEYVAAVVTSERMVLQTKSKSLEPLILKGFLTLRSGHIVSHIRVHKNFLLLSKPLISSGDNMTKKDYTLTDLGLKFNPFPSAATGSAFINNMWLPGNWHTNLDDNIQQLTTNDGAKATMIIGSYGSGKSYLLQYLKVNFQQRRIRPFIFDNPETTFYGLVNQLLRQIGRYEFAKAMWEFLYDPTLAESLQQRLFDLSFSDWLLELKAASKRNTAIHVLGEAMQASNLVSDGEVAFRFAQLIVDTRERPYFQFRDFIPSRTRSLVAERQEATYFTALIRILLQVFEADGIAFLIDEFEDVALGKRMGARQRAEYTSTVRRLLATAAAEEFWLVLSVTPEGLEQTKKIEPSLVERFGPSFVIPNLEVDDAYGLVQHRLQEARIGNSDEGLWPFAEDAIEKIPPTSRIVARKLIKVMGHALGWAIRKQVELPISADEVRKASLAFSEEK